VLRPGRVSRGHLEFLIRPHLRVGQLVVVEVHANVLGVDDVRDPAARHTVLRVHANACANAQRVASVRALGSVSGQFTLHGAR
jgi:hypothetical protein